MAVPFGTADPNVLTEREIQVLRLVADGYTAEQIGTRIGRSAATVRSHLESLRAKLGARNACHAVSLGHLAGYLAGGAK